MQFDSKMQFTCKQKFAIHSQFVPLSLWRWFDFVLELFLIIVLKDIFFIAVMFAGSEFSTHW